MPGSVYSRLARRLAEHEGETYPLHVGDTWMEPPAGCRMEDLQVEEYPGMHRYASPHGLLELREVIAARTTERTGVRTEVDQVLVSAGATGALGAAAGALVAEGEEVLLLAPFWPLIRGIVESFHGVATPVPFIGRADGPESAVETVEAALSPRTVALYVNTPNNPTGRVLPLSWLEALAAWAHRHDLWLLADDVYEDYVYEGEHVSLRALAPQRTLAVHSFSKAYGMAGNRCGYVVGPADVVEQLRKVATHTFYSTPTASQIAALRALEGPGDEWAAAARDQYARTGRAAAARLGVDPPEGSTFLFLDVADSLDPDADSGLDTFLERCADRGLLVAPGPSFGPYPTHVRLCFTAAPPEVVERGVDVLAELLDRRG